MAPYGATARRDTAEREDYLILMEQVRKLEGRQEGMEMEVASLNRSMDGVTRNAAQDVRSESEALRAALASLESRISALESARSRDREEIIDQLTRKITQIMGERASARPPPARGSGGSDYGYEHVVQAGENLSRIAAAYNVSVQRIIEVNELSKPDQLKVGQKLFIPE
jgi:nucleoid-associated protein YgaU